MILPAAFMGASLPAVASNAAANDDLGAGIAPSFGILGFKGKVWSIRFGGTDTPLMREDGDGPRNSLEVVLVKASPMISKIFYNGGYVDGSNEKPDCWSGDGIKPDASVQNKVNPTCQDCPMNAWGSRISEAGKDGKMCADSRRVAVVPAGDFDNELGGGPMLLRIPAASLKALKAYGDLLKSYGFPYFTAVTKISFDPKEAYPKFVFEAMRPLGPVEAEKILMLQQDQRVHAVVNETALAVGMAGDGSTAPSVPSSPFTQPQPAAQTLSQQAAAKGPAATTAAPKPAAPKTAPSTAAAKDKTSTATVAAPADTQAMQNAALLKAQIAALEAQLKGQTAPQPAEVTAKPDQSSPEEAVVVSEEAGAADDPATDGNEELVGQFDDLLEKLMVS
jgi:hypothetical protein